MKVQQQQIQILNDQMPNGGNNIISSDLSSEQVAQRLKSLFSLPIDLSDNYYFSSLVDCTGKIEGNSIIIRFVKYGRGNLHYDLTGQILNNPNGGSEIELKIYDRNSLWGYLGFGLVGFFLPILIGSSQLIPWYLNLLCGIVLAAVLIGIYLLIEIEKRKSVLRNICEVLQKNLRND